MTSRPPDCSLSFFSALALLDPVDREALVDRHVLGQTHGEIARALGCSVARVQYRLDRAARVMCSALDGKAARTRAHPSPARL